MNVSFKSPLIFLFIICFSCAQDKNPVNTNHTYEVVIPDLQIPWGFVFMPDGSILYSEKAGQLVIFKNDEKTIIEGLPEIYVRGQGGLMDILLHPNYAENGWIYFTYASSDNVEDGGNTTVMRAKLSENTLINQEVLYKATPDSKRGQHFGSRLAFDAEGHLYFSIGDRGDRDVNPQDITRDCGKIYRINDDGSIPADNPFINEPNAVKAIYSFGHRNPQGMTVHPETGEIWTQEHGPRGGDEINIIKAGKNYGWPVISYGINYNGTSFTDFTEMDGMEQPLHYWDPSIAPSGMAFISSDKYPGWKGNLLIGSLKFEYLDKCTIENGKVVKEERLLDGLGRVRTVVQGPDGFIYVGIENLGIVKLLQE